MLKRTEIMMSPIICMQIKNNLSWPAKNSWLPFLLFLMLPFLVLPTTILAQVSIETNLNLSSGNIEIVLSGDWTNNGNFESGRGKVTFNGNTKQTITNPNGETFHNVTVDKAGGLLEINNPVEISGLFSVLNGDVNLNGHDITMGIRALLAETPGNTVKGRSGFIKTTRSLNAPTNNNVAGLGFEITSVENLGSTLIKRGHAVQSNNGDKSILRFFDVSLRNNTGLNATIIFHYDDSELKNNTEAGLELFRSTDGGNTWNFRGGTLNTATNEISLAAVDALSRWTTSSNQFEPPDLEITKTNDTEGMVDVNDTFQWTNTVSNTGAGDAVFADGDTIIVDNLPNGTVAYADVTPETFVKITNEANINCTITGAASKDLVCKALGDDVTIGGFAGLGAGSFNVVYNVTPSVVDTLINPRENGICEVDPNKDVKESDEGNNLCEPDTVIVKGSDVELVEKSISDITPTAGDTITFTIVVRNNGPGTAKNVVVSDTLQIGVTYVPESITHNDTARTDVVDADNSDFAVNTITVNLGSMAVSQKDTIRFKVKVDLNSAGSSINNEAIVAATQDDDPDNNSKTASINPVGVVGIQNVNITIAPEFSFPFFNFETHQFQFDLAIRNTSAIAVLFPPLFVEFVEILTEDPGPPVTVANSDGGGTGVGAFYDYSNSLGQDNQLDPNDPTDFKTWIFNDPGDVKFFFTANVFGIPITSSPLAKSTGSVGLKFFVDVKNEKIELISITTDVEEPTPLELPKDFVLHQNYPNPFNPETTIRYELPEPTEVVMIIYNLRGQLVRELVNQQMEAGFHEIVWDARDDTGRSMSSGVYLYRIQAGSFTEVRKLMLLR